MGKTIQQRWNLLGSGEDTYASQNAQDPRTSRKVQSWIPTDDGSIHRELPEPLYLPTTLTGPIVGLYEFDQGNGTGGVTRFYFAAARTNFIGAKTCNFYQSNGSSWFLVSAVGVLADAPMCAQQEDNFFVADGLNNWLFNGSIWVKDGLSIPLNQPAINITNGTSTVYFDSTGVTVKLYNDSSLHVYNGAVGLNYPNSLSPVSTATKTSAGGCSLQFNPTAYNGTTDPNVHPMQWATLNSGGSITGYTQPWAGESLPYNMTVVCKLVIPAPGSYTLAMNHDDGAFFGFGTGAAKGGAVTITGGGLVNVWQSGTAEMGYVPLGGNNNSANGGPWNETFVVHFPNADTYGLEINYCSWENEQELVFMVNGTTPLPAASSNPGNINASLGRYYWFTNGDQTSGVATESSSSPIGVVSGPLVGATVDVYQQPGKFTSSTGSATVTGSSSTDNPGPTAPSLNSTMAGQVLHLNGTLLGTIASVSGNNFVLTANAGASISNGRAVVSDSRCTHWNIYASESDGSKIGQYLVSVPVTKNLTSSPQIDSSPFLDDVANTFLPVFRPVRNDAPPPSKLLTVHKVRQWRRVESSPNFFNFTANEEVTSGNNGDPAQCCPGADVNTVSDMVNEVSFPDQSARLRGLVPHLDALFMFSEKQCYPLYGQSVDDFAISQVIAFALGLSGRFAAKSTPNGLAFISYDRKAFLYPSSLYSTYLAQGGAATSALQEIGKPMRTKFQTIDPARLDEVVTEYYHFGIRDWFVVAFPQIGGTYVTYVYDFNNRGWFQLQQGFSALAVFEVAEGKLVLIGGGIDGKAYVIDDQTGTYATSGNLPQAIWRPALIDFGNTETAHVFQYLELEFSSAAMAQDLTITVWLDPIDIDNPGVGRTLALRPALGANRYRAFLQGGAVCQRMLLEVSAKASTNAGAIRGIKLVANTAPGIIGGGNYAGGV
ncbi:MAG TPA: hypothetical protein VI386_17950 [Candidatus Sulfotelmatobacter sp.]